MFNRQVGADGGDLTAAKRFAEDAMSVLVPVLGVVENMSGYACPACNHISHPFGTGGAEAEAAAMGVPFLGRIPLDIALRVASDAGEPATGAHAAMFDALATAVAERLEL